ncbi:MAG: hypothetical protein IH621_01050 [Krumholzibacteria bacterium]|nr:hypothetical protein [Candidatus Krumholzibacteria bacterium]
MAAVHDKGSSYPPTDLHLAQRLEGAEAAASIAFVEAHAALNRDVGATHMRIGVVAAIFDGPESPLTQTFGLGVFGAPGTAEFESIENSFLSRSAPVQHEVSGLAATDTVVQLSARGYRTVEFSTVLVRPASIPLDGVRGVAVRRIRPEEGPLWCRTAAEGGGSESAELADFIEAFGAVMVRAADVQCFLAEIAGRPVATGALCLAGDVALLAAASTIPSARRQGAQLALLGARLDYALAQRAGLAMMVAQPDSASMRNAEFQGFRTAYTRTKWWLAGGAA